MEITLDSIGVENVGNMDLTLDGKGYNLYLKACEAIWDGYENDGSEITYRGNIVWTENAINDFPQNALDVVLERIQKINPEVSGIYYSMNDSDEAGYIVVFYHSRYVLTIHNSSVPENAQVELYRQNQNGEWLLGYRKNANDFTEIHTPILPVPKNANIGGYAQPYRNQ